MTNAPTLEFPSAPTQPPPSNHRRGRRRWVGWVAGLAVLVLIGALTLYFATRSGTAQPAATGPSAIASSTTSAPAVVLGTSPGPAPSSTAHQSSSTPANPAPNGRIPLATLKNATLDIPAWPADNMRGPSGPITFTGGAFTVPPDAGYWPDLHMTIERVAYGDVDRDGMQETVATIHLLVGTGSQQVIAFDRDTTGRIVTLGAVLSTTGRIRAIDPATVHVQANGAVTAKVADYEACCGDQTPQLWQWRTFGWNGRAFRQVGGPTVFPVNPAVSAVAIRVGDLVLGPAIGGIQHGTLTVSVSFVYGAVPDRMRVTFFNLPAGLQPDGDAWPPTYLWNLEPAVDVRPTPAGTWVTYTFAFSQRQDGPTAGMAVGLMGLDEQRNMINDPDLYDNLKPVTIRTAD